MRPHILWTIFRKEIREALRDRRTLTVMVLIPVLLYLRSGEHPASLLSVLVIAAAIPAFKTAFTKTDGPSLNRLLAQTGGLLTIYSVLFSLGWLL